MAILFLSQNEPMNSAEDDADDWKNVSFSQDFVKKIYING